MRLLLGVIVIIILLTSFCQAVNVIDISIEGLDTGDTILAGYPYKIQISIANDSIVWGMGLGFRLYAPSGDFTWEWRDVGGYGPHGYVTVEEGCRMDPPNITWDLGGFQVNEKNVDGILPDSILFGGAAFNGGLAAGPLEHMVTLYGLINSSNIGPHDVFCIDSTFIPPAGPFVFQNAVGGTYVPTVTWSPGGRCYPVGIYMCNFPRTEDNIYDETVSGKIGQTATTAKPIQWFFPYQTDTTQIREIIGGQGEASVNNYGDGVFDILYTPVAADAGLTVEVHAAPYDASCDYFWNEYTLFVNVAPIEAGDMNADGEVNVGDAVSLINYIFRAGPAPLDMACSDVNQDCEVNIGDAVYLVRFIFSGGPEPVCSDCVF